MYMIAIGQPSPGPARPRDGTALHLACAGDDLSTHARMRLSRLAPVEEREFEGTLHLGLLTLKLEGGRMPVVLFRIGRLKTLAPFALGVAREEERAELASVLQNAPLLTRDATWGIMMELVEGLDGRTRGLRFAAPKPAFWQAFAEAALDSGGIDRAAQTRAMLKLEGRHSTDALFRRAPVVQKFR